MKVIGRSMFAAMLLTVVLAAVSSAAPPFVSGMLCDRGAGDGNFLPLQQGHVLINDQGDLHIKARGVTPNGNWDCTLFSSPPYGSGQSVVRFSCGTSDNAGNLSVNIHGFLAPGFTPITWPGIRVEVHENSSSDEYCTTGIKVE